MSIVHLKNKKTGVTYVYESTGYWDKEKQQARNNRKCIGKLDPNTGKLIPSKKNENDSSSSLAERGLLSLIAYKRSFYGTTYLLMQLVITLA